jgi:hypothetical protein
LDPLLKYFPKEVALGGTQTTRDNFHFSRLREAYEIL